MSPQPKRGITLVEVLVIVLIIGVLLALIPVATQAQREAARRAACIHNMKQLGLALHNFHDARKKFPGATSTSWADAPALVASGPWGVPPEPASPAFDDDGDGRIDRGNGWSWTKLIEPYFEENCLYKRVRINEAPGSSVLAMPWNGTTGSGANECRYTSQCRMQISNEEIDPGKQLPPWEQIPLFRCPSFSGGNAVDPPEGLDAYGPYDPSNPEHEPVAISNYACLGASHFPSLLKNTRLNTPAPGTPEEDEIGYEGTGKASALSHPNGTMYPGSRNGIRDIKDGTSNTILLCETREEHYSAWFDGAVGCLVGLVFARNGPQPRRPARRFVHSPPSARSRLTATSSRPAPMRSKRT